MGRLGSVRCLCTMLLIFSLVSCIVSMAFSSGLISSCSPEEAKVSPVILRLGSHFTFLYHPPHRWQDWRRTAMSYAAMSLCHSVWLLYILKYLGQIRRSNWSSWNNRQPPIFKTNLLYQSRDISPSGPGHPHKCMFLWQEIKYSFILQHWSDSLPNYEGILALFLLTTKDRHFSVWGSCSCAAWVLRLFHLSCTLKCNEKLLLHCLKALLVWNIGLTNLFFSRCIV